MNFETVFESTYEDDNLPEGLDPRNYKFRKVEVCSDFHEHLKALKTVWRNGSTFRREGENSFQNEDIPEILVSNSNDSSYKDHSFTEGDYNFRITSWFSVCLEGEATTYFQPVGKTEFGSIEVSEGQGTLWADGYCRLPIIPHYRTHRNNFTTFCLIPKTGIEMGGSSTLKNTTPYRYEYFNVSAGETIRTRACSTEFHGTLILVKGRVDGYDTTEISYVPQKNDTFVALEDTIAISCVRY